MLNYHKHFQSSASSLSVHVCKDLLTAKVQALEAENRMLLRRLDALAGVGCTIGNPSSAAAASIVQTDQTITTAWLSTLCLPSIISRFSSALSIFAPTTLLQSSYRSRHTHGFSPMKCPQDGIAGTSIVPRLATLVHHLVVFLFAERLSAR